MASLCSWRHARRRIDDDEITTIFVEVCLILFFYFFFTWVILSANVDMANVEWHIQGLSQLHQLKKNCVWRQRRLSLTSSNSVVIWNALAVTKRLTLQSCCSRKQQPPVTLWMCHFIESSPWIKAPRLWTELGSQIKSVSMLMGGCLNLTQPPGRWTSQRF